MKVTLALIFLFLFSGLCYAQNFMGTWEGKLNISPPLRIVFTFSQKTGGSIKAAMQSPDQSNAILPTDTCYIKNDSIFTTEKKLGISFRGKLIADSIIQGVFTQGKNLPLVLKKVNKVTQLKRPQTPQAPFAYHNEEVSFFNLDKSIQFAGTLTWPQTEPGTEHFRKPIYPAVILISGSGPQNRDETIFGHKPFAVLADYLTKKGFAVLRVDDRGVGASTGNFATATTADFANDTEAAIDFLKQQQQIDTAHIGLIGHSEGGLIAPIVAARRNDIGFIVLLAGPGIAITKLMAEQVEAVGKSAGQNAAMQQAGKELFSIASVEVLKEKDAKVIKINTAKKVESWAAKKNTLVLKQMNLSTPQKRNAFLGGQLSALTTNWYRYFLSINPQHYLAKLKCPVLALNGSKDIQVLPASNLEGIRAALKKSKSPQYNVVEIPGLNHLFQTCKTCTAAEYAELEESFSPTAMEIIGNWLLQYGR